MTKRHKEWICENCGELMGPDEKYEDVCDRCVKTPSKREMAAALQFIDNALKPSKAKKRTR